MGIGEQFEFERSGTIEPEPRKHLLSVTISDGKYTVVQDNKGALTALRYKEEWRDCCGDGLILALAQEVDDLRKKVEKAKNCLVCSSIASPMEVCENMLIILEGGSE